MRALILLIVMLVFLSMQADASSLNADHLTLYI
jgi:hypothetical protein